MATSDPPPAISAQQYDAWAFRPNAPPIPPPFSAILTAHSNIPPDSQQSHILRVRDAAYTSKPYPCLGRFRFLALDFSIHPLYSSYVIPLLTSPSSSLTPPRDPIIADLGSCLGQDLRKLMVDGVPAERIYGADLDTSFLDAGYDLFRDEAKLPRSHFLIPSDLLNLDADDALAALDGRCDVVHITAVFHLFDLATQRIVAQRVARLLRPDPGQKKLILGAQVGKLVAGNDVGRDGVSQKFRHDAASWQALWDECLGTEEWRAAGVKAWEVNSDLQMRRQVEQEKGEGWLKDSVGDVDKARQTRVMGADARWHVWSVWVQF